MNNDKKYLYFTQFCSTVLTALLFISCTKELCWQRIVLTALPAVYFILVFFLKQKALYPYLLFSAVVLCYILPIRNFLPVIFCMLYSLGRTNKSYISLCLYLTNILIAASLREEGIISRINYSQCLLSLSIHLVLIAFIYITVVYFSKAKYELKKLDLTEDERKILEEYKITKQLKSVTCFSKNTITEKLKRARERNAVDTNAELLDRYLITEESQ